jgi:hypothetical protein
MTEGYRPAATPAFLFVLATPLTIAFHNGPAIDSMYPARKWLSRYAIRFAARTNDFD